MAPSIDLFIINHLFNASSDGAGIISDFIALHYIYYSEKCLCL
ncbi:hypothetical protein AD31_6132 [Escherichia coli 2-427-07_S4_C3]|nr:hypothetical protein AD31_6132 [Escherichia coli 2-427-07_S4_C3]